MNLSILRSMNAKTVTAGVLALAITAGPLSAAAVVVDWLQFVPGTGGAFTLRDDGGNTAAGGAIVVSSGVVFFGTPAARNLSAEFWGISSPLAEDSTAGNGSVSGFLTRVVSSGGQPSYQVELSVPENRLLYLMAGDLMWTAAAATQGLEIRAVSDAGNASVHWIGDLAGNDGSKEYSGGLSWDGTTLSTQPGTDGDSRFALFEIGPLAGGNAKVILTIPQGSSVGYAPGSGDSLFFALGVGVIPEPSVALLGTFGALVLFGKRHRRKG